MLFDSSSIVARRPFVIFLDINGVMYNNPDPKGVFKKVDELFPALKDYDELSCSIAAAHFFDKKALKNLDRIITEIEKTKRVSIVISSAWREHRTVEELRKQVFGIHNFSKYIIDKTPEKLLYEGRKSYCTRGEEIQHWLKKHPEVIDFLVLDDNDDDLTINFGKRFVQTTHRFLLTDEIATEILKNHTQ